MQEKLMFPSMMCVDVDNYKEEIKLLVEAGVDSFHCDVMDGSFVPNMTMGIMDIKAIRKHTTKMIDVHLMIENPAEKVKWFIDAGADLIYIHPESERYTTKTLQMIKEAGKLAGIAINPDTSIEMIREVLNCCDYVMVMTVNPGFAGQKYIDFVTDKVKKLAQLKERFHFKIIIDGACSPEKIIELSALKADGFVLGTSALFGKNRSYKEIINELKS